MAGLKASDQSHIADALLLAALFLPFLPIVTTFDLYLAALALGCPADAALACARAGLDFNALHARSADMLQWTATASASGLLLVYMLLVAGLTQFTIQGFRGRVVRTCAVIMWAGVLPLILGLAAAAAHGPVTPGQGPFTSFAFFGQVFFDWLANIAVPLAVLVTGLLALTLGYRALVGWVMSHMPARD